MSSVGLRGTIWVHVCEPASRWLPALKSLTTADDRPDWILRVRSGAQRPNAESLADIDSPAVMLVEVGNEDFADALAWIRSASRLPAIAVVALLDQSLASSDTAPEASLAFREAGAIGVLRTTHELAGVPALARRHAERVRVGASDDTTLREIVWRRLPWQPDPRPLR